MKMHMTVLPVSMATVLLMAATSSASAETLSLVERATTDAVVDIGDTGDSTGDVLTFANEVYDADNKMKVGSDQGWCIRIVPGKSWECVFTVFLDGGQMTSEGPFIDGQDSVWAITGGTGKYAEARGEMKLHSRDEKGSEFDMAFDVK